MTEKFIIPGSGPKKTFGVQQEGYGEVGDGTVIVATLGTKVQFPNIECKRVLITSHEDNGSLTNGGLIVIGGTNVVAASNGRRGASLYAGQADWFKVSNLNKLFVDSVDNGAKITYYYET